MLGWHKSIRRTFFFFFTHSFGYTLLDESLECTRASGQKVSFVFSVSMRDSLQRDDKESTAIAVVLVWFSTGTVLTAD